MLFNKQLCRNIYLGMYLGSKLGFQERGECTLFYLRNTLLRNMRLKMSKETSKKHGQAEIKKHN